MISDEKTLIVETKILDSRLKTEFGLPSYQTSGAAGMDLHACLSKPAEISPDTQLLVKSGVAISILNPHYVAIIAPRSGLSVKHGIVLANTIGVIDSDYQDEILIALLNQSNKTYVLNPGERICQLLFLPIARATLKIVDSFSQMTERGTGGFGSTGK